MFRRVRSRYKTANTPLERVPVIGRAENDDDYLGLF